MRMIHGNEMARAVVTSAFCIIVLVRTVIYFQFTEGILLSRVSFCFKMTQKDSHQRTITRAQNRKFEITTTNQLFHFNDHLRER